MTNHFKVNSGLKSDIQIRRQAKSYSFIHACLCIICSQVLRICVELHGGNLMLYSLYCKQPLPADTTLVGFSLSSPCGFSRNTPGFRYTSRYLLVSQGLRYQSGIE
jgi:hypothetical protein